MKHLILKSAAAAALACIVPAASAAVLNFDNLGGPGFFTANYNGFQIGTNVLATTAWYHTNDVSAIYTPHSGATYLSTDYQLYNNVAYEATQPISNTTAFIFDGAWFSGGDTVGYELYNGSTKVFTSTPSAELGNVPLFVSSGYSGLVTSVVVFGRQGYYAMDDFTYTAAPVPEPETYALMLAGLAAIGFAARRRKV